MHRDLDDCARAFAAIGRTARVLPTTGSTNDDARAWANDGAPHGAIVIADAQTSGRGRHGRSWSSPPGASLAMSIVLRPLLAPAMLPPLSLVAGLAVQRVIERAVERVTERVIGARAQVRVKWPNDVVVTVPGEASIGRKIAGILVEAAISSSRVEHVVVGIGINVARDSFDAALAARATSLALVGVVVSRTELALDVARAFDEELQGYLDDPSSIGARLRPHDALLGARVAVEGKGVFVADGIEADGRLRVRREDGVVEHAVAGEVTVMDGRDDRA